MKLLVGQDIGSYTFDPATDKIYFEDIPDLRHGAILMVTNITRGVILYLPLDPATIATFSNNTLTLTKDCSTYSASDELQIFIESENNQTELLLRRVLKALEASANVDSAGRQRVVAENSLVIGSGTITTITNTVPVSMSNLVGLNGIDARFFQGDTVRSACLAQYRAGLEFTA